DVYRGCEGWDLALVDPDNRRPVDHDRLAAQLAAPFAGSDGDWEDVRARWRDATVKVLVTARLLRARRDHADVFAHGGYDVPRVTGSRADHVLALMRCARGEGGACALAVAARLPM